jgi:hypothetical protein
MQAESITVFVGGRNSKQRKITKHFITIIISQFSKKAETKFSFGSYFSYQVFSIQSFILKENLF